MHSTIIGYVPKEFPKYLYARDGRAVVVASAAEQAALQGDWRESPAAFTQATPIADPPGAGPATPPPAVGPDTVPGDPAVTGEDVAAALERERLEAEGLYSASVAAIVDRIPTASREALERIQRLELGNPKGPRKTVLRAVEAALAAPQG